MRLRNRTIVPKYLKPYHVQITSTRMRRMLDHGYFKCKYECALCDSTMTINYRKEGSSIYFGYICECPDKMKGMTKIDFITGYVKPKETYYIPLKP